MMTRLTLLAFAIASLSSCQTIMRHYLGMKNPEIEKEKTVIGLMEKHKIANAHFVKKEKIYDAYIGPFPKVYIFDKKGYQVLLPNCYEMIVENLYRLADTIPKELSPEAFRDKFVEETIQTEENRLQLNNEYDYEVYFYWSVWIGKFNIKKLQTAQKTIDAINQGPSQKKILLVPVNFDFIEESGWTEASVEAEMKRLSEQNKPHNSTDPIQSLNVAKAQLLTVNKQTVLVVASQREPTKVTRYYVLQGEKTKEQIIPKSVLNESSDFVSLQAGSYFWVLTLSQSDRYRNLLTNNAKTYLLEGFGLAKYQEEGLDFEAFVADLKSGKRSLNND